MRLLHKCEYALCVVHGKFLLKDVPMLASCEVQAPTLASDLTFRRQFGKHAFTFVLSCSETSSLQLLLVGRWPMTGWLSSAVTRKWASSLETPDCLQNGNILFLDESQTLVKTAAPAPIKTAVLPWALHPQASGGTPNRPHLPKVFPATSSGEEDKIEHFRLEF